MNQFLPVTMEEKEQRGWKEFDFIIVSGDAYVDHPSFGTAIIGRVLERRGYKVGIIPQPNWKDQEDFKKLGRPRLAFLVTGGNIDSMVNHYTVAKNKRKEDLYSPGGKAGYRPDRATIIYSSMLREIYGDIPIVLGGIEASLRRMAHYDYWSNKIRRSILLDAKADLLVYGMGEKQIVEIAEALESGLAVRDITFIKGTVFKTKDRDLVHQPVVLPSYDDVLKSKKAYAKSFMLQKKNTDPITANPLIESYRDWYVVQNIPASPLTTMDFDDVYELPYVRKAHPMYEKQGGIPAIQEVQFSIIVNRGCFGNCSFCALTYHQGVHMTTRSHQSVVREATEMTKDPDFKGYIHDVGGPTANFTKPPCKKQAEKGACSHRDCLAPEPCPSLEVSHEDYLKLLRRLRKIEGIKKIFIRSGIRYDYLIYDKDESFFKELCEHHVSGQLKVAPEHVSNEVLEKMGKPGVETYEKFHRRFEQINQKLGKKQFVVPYLMSSHPGSTLHHAVQLAEYLRDQNIMPKQVQDFYPTPATLSTCMFYTGYDPRTMEPVYVPIKNRDKARQRALIQYKKPQNKKLVVEALKEAGREDLIGSDKKALVYEATRDFKNPKNKQHKKNKRSGKRKSFKK